MARGILVSMFLALACVPERREFPASRPLQTVVVSGSDVICRLDPAATLADAVDLGIFQGVKDDPSLQVLQSRFGASVGKRTDERSTDWMRFRVSGGHVEAGKQREESGTEVWYLWRVYAVPDDGDPKKLFHPEVLRHIDAQGTYALSFEDTRRDEGIWCSIRHGSVERCRWFRLRPPPLPSP